ncbi:hypothetical protein CsSME_00035828 [Camellia sinensis var. sinensis]
MMSPSRVRNGGVASTVNNDLGNTPSILSFAADVRRGKVGDAHLLRLLHNRHLQWRFINARADNAMMVQKVTAEVYSLLISFFVYGSFIFIMCKFVYAVMSFFYIHSFIFLLPLPHYH